MAIGWLIFEDLFTVVALVLLPVIASAADTQHARLRHRSSRRGVTIGAALGKAVLLTALMLVVGSRVLPWVLTRVEERLTRLFTLAVLATAIGIAFAEC